MGILKRGSRGADVIDLQKRLYAAGQHIAADGVYGEITERAVRNFQSQNGLSVDGIAGPKTFEMLQKITGKPANTGGSGRTITAAQLRQIMPNAGSRADTFVGPLNAAMQKYQINTPARQAAFLAQVGHESGQLRYVREIWGPTAAQKRYEGRKDLGNTQPGDGKRFMGRGLIQLTGRANYTKYAKLLNLPLVEQPELLEQPINAAMSAAAYWDQNGLNALADAGQFETITRRINGGLNGQADRVALWNRAKKVL